MSEILNTEAPNVYDSIEISTAIYTLNDESILTIKRDSLLFNAIREIIEMDNEINEEVKLLSEEATSPTRSTANSACYDLYSAISTIVQPHTNLLIKTDIALYWDNPLYYCQLLSRSGLAYKNNITVQAGVIDRDYRKAIGVILQNNSDVPFVVNKGDRIAQYTYLKIASVTSCEVTDFTPLVIAEGEVERTGGFGSTGV